MSRVTHAQINLQALKHNLQVARQSAPTKQMAIIKANGYGHGIVEVARALRDADAFGVATIEEGITLREAGIYKPVILLEGFQRTSDFLLIHAYDLDCVIHHPFQVDLLQQVTDKPVRPWIKLDTGMNRLGFTPADFNDAVEALKLSEHIRQPLRLMTHLACADEHDSDRTGAQIALFDRTCDSLSDFEQTICNSAGILGWPVAHRDWVRPGIMLYGVSPFTSGTGSEYGLQPVMTLLSEIISIKTVKQGETVGYGGTHICNQDSRVGVIAIGYGDGYPRHAVPGTPVLVRGKLAPLIGRVSMDMITVDLSEIEDASIGDEVVLWGEGLPVEIIAEHSGTIAYELLCGVTQRVERKYVP